MTTERLTDEALADKGLAAFAEYFRKNYPGPDTIIGNPDWHAPRIYRAALDAHRRATPADEARGPGCEWCVDGVQADGETPCPCATPADDLSAALDTPPSEAPQKEWCPFEDDCVGDRPDLDFVREDLRAEKARDEEISRRHFNEGWRLTNEMPVEEDGWRDRVIYAERGHHLALRQCGELSTRVSAWHEIARSLEKQLEEAGRASQAASVPPPADDLRAFAREGIVHAVNNLMTHLETFHDSEEESREAGNLRQVMHHLEGVLLGLDDAALSQPARAPQPSLTDRELRDQIVGEAE